ncbi:MAG: nitrate- and nitrite sensing domain-containing protein, partial [Hyphomicrobiales bacterium]|nr:nitrate- and nitrite sensing domain-containing protein [Hyphomicrobiales bacterium]
MNVINNMKLSRMIIFLALVPILATLFFSSQIILDSMKKSAAMGDLGRLTALAVKISNLVHEQQKERGATAVFLGSGGKKFVAELPAQRQETDKKKAELKAFLAGFDPQKYGETFNKDFQAVMTILGKMGDIRTQVDALSISAPEAIGYYTGLNGKNLKLVEFMGSLSPDPVIVSRFVGYSNYLQGKERAGIERAVGANGFSSGQFTPKAYSKFKLLISAQDTYYNIFLAHATDEQKALFKKIMAGEAAQEVERMRKVAFDGGLEGNLQGITGKAWFDTITKKINGLKQIENTLGQNLLNELRELEAEAATTEWLAIVETLAALLIAGGLAFVIIRSVTGSFRTITSAMTNLADGKLDVELPPVRNNEIGDMVKCVQVFKDSAIEKVELEKRQEEAAKQAEEEKKQMMQKLAD